MKTCAYQLPILLALAASLGLPACQPAEDEGFHTVADDDAGDDDTADDDVVVDDDDASGQTPLDNGVEYTPEELPYDPCGPIYEPANPLSGDPPVLAKRTALGVGDDPAPYHVRTGFYRDAETSFAVLWQTDVDTTASVIEWGEQSTLENRQVVYTYLTGPEWGDKTRVHMAVVCDLQPGTTYTYRVGIDGAFSPDYPFTTFDSSDSALSALVLGDSRGGEAQIMGPMLDQAMYHWPQLMLHTGDFVGWGGDVGAWGDFFEYSQQLFPWIPLIPVHGNHEGHAEEFYGLTAMPSDEAWYSLTVGPLHIVVLNSSMNDASLEAQAQWLDADLTANTAPFTIVAMHHCMYSSGSHGSDEQLQQAWLHVVDWHHVDIIFSGHDHGYERTAPMYSQHRVDSAAEGTIYVVTGGGGAGLYSFSGDVFTEVMDEAFHYGHLWINGDVLRYTAYRDDGSELDHFEIDKTP